MGAEMMKRFFATITIALLASAQAFALETGSSNQVYRIPSGGGRARFGAVDVSQSAAVTGVLPLANGGTGMASFDSSYELRNIGLSASVGSSALTVTLRQKDGSSNCSSTAPCRIGFRSSTATSGSYNQRSITAGLSVTVPSTATLGQVSATAEPTFIYAQDNAGSVQLCVSTSGTFDEGVNQTSTIINTSSTSRSTIYCTASATGPVRLIGRLVSTQATAGTWATAPSLVSLTPLAGAQISSASSTLERLERAAFGGNTAMTSNCASTPCTIASQSGSWVSSVSRVGAGAYTVNITAGEFSVAPTCTCSGKSMGFWPVACAVSSVTTSGVTVETFGATSGSNVLNDSAVHIICMGPR